MEEKISALMAVMREEIGLYRDLIAHARKKTALLVRGSLDALMESNKVEEAFNSRLRVLENDLKRLCSEIGQLLNLSREEITLLRLADGVKSPYADEIRSQSTLFKNLVEQLKQVNRRNIRLLESSLQYSRGLLDFIANATGSYEDSGLLKPCTPHQTRISSKA